MVQWLTGSGSFSISARKRCACSASKYSEDSEKIEATIGPKDRTLFVNQVNDSLGYFIPPEHFRPEPVQWGEGHHFTGHELESLGRSAGEIIREALGGLAREPASGDPGILSVIS